MKRSLYKALALGLAFSLTVGCAKQDTIGTVTPETAKTSVTAAPAAQTEPSPTPAAAEAGTVLAQTEDAGRSYVDETLFIGDSNTARYMMYADETGTAFTSLKNNIGVVSMGVGAITTLKCEQFKGDSQMYTIPEAVAKLKPRRIIICFGTNNLGGTSTDATSFIKTYRSGLQAIEEAWPYAEIIVSAIPPLDKQRENTRLDMVQVDAYNEALLRMCEEDGYRFLNSAEVLRDDATGWAKKDYTLSDGVHLSKAAVTTYFNYVRTHASQAPDERPQPLGTIPEPDGVPLGLISSDPIAVRGAKVPVEFVSGGGGSISGQTSGVGYPTSKFAVNGMTISLARELAKDNIRVNAVAPGITETDMMKAVPKEVIDPLIAQIPLRRLGQPEDIANAFTFLASDEASYITGVILSVDGMSRA